MGIFDKFRKKDDDFGDLSGLGDFGLDDKSSAGGADLGGGLDSGLGDFPSLTQAEQPEMPAHREEVQPTPGSLDMGNNLGLSPQPPHDTSTYPAAPAAPVHPASMSQTPVHPAARPAPVQAQPAAYQPQPQVHAMGELSKDIEIIHAKLDAIKSSLDSINQRLATLERMASGESGNKSRYTW